MVAAAENMQAFGWDLFSGNRDSVFLGSGSIAGDELDISSFVVLPGFVDVHVHLREPGFSYKETISSGTLAAARGGYSRVCAMPNLDPAPDSLQTLAPQLERIRTDAVIDVTPYGAITAHRGGRELADMEQLAPYVAGFSDDGSGVQDADVMRAAMRKAASLGKLIAAHCEDEPTVRADMERFRTLYGESGLTAAMHPLIRSAEACLRSSEKAVSLAERYGGRLHVLHLSTARELSLFDRDKPLEQKRITCEVCVHHLWFSDADYARKGNLIKWNPAVKTAADRDALRAGLLDGAVDVVATDHAPHTLEEKERPYASAPSGGPLVQHSLPMMLELSAQGVLPVETIVEKMCHAPARLFGVRDRGFLRTGHFADIVLVRPADPWTVSKENILYKCGWSPLEGTAFSHRIVRTLVNGRTVYADGRVDTTHRGAELEFDR